MSIKYDAFKNIAIASYISQSDADNLIDKINTSINNINILKELNTDNVEPFIHPFVTISSLRSDIAISQDKSSALGQISPAFDNNNYIVPIILGKG